MCSIINYDFKMSLNILENLFILCLIKFLKQLLTLKKIIYSYH